MKKILAINPGATSTKVAIFDGNEQIFLKNIKHSTEELSQFATIADQYEFRKNIITSTLEAEGINLHDISIVMGRGGLVKPLKSGVYRVNDLMLEHLKMGYSGQHACNLGGLIADSIAKYIGLECAYIADPVMVDEMQEIARISGHPDFERQSIFHALNHKAIGRMYRGGKERLYFISTRNKETLWDFADALREYGFIDAIYITGGTDYGFYRDKAGTRHDIGDSADYPHTKWKGIIPWLVFRK